MNVYEPQNIRNIAILGHAGSGKTTLAESILLQSGAINRRGTVEEHNTQSDYNEIEHERGCSIFGTPLFAEWNNKKINIIDTPGYDDYVGELIAATYIADAGVITINAQNGVEFGTENAWYYSQKNNLPVALIVNKTDMDQGNFDEAVTDAQEYFGRKVTIVQYPLHSGPTFHSVIDILKMAMIDYSSGKPEKKEIPADEMAKVEKIRGELIDSIAETDEDLMNTYFENGELTEEELKTGFKKAFIARQIFPVFCISSKKDFGTESILNFITDVCPSPMDGPGRETIDGKFIKANQADHCSLFVFKMISEAHLGDMTFFKVISGKLVPGMDLINEQKSASDRFSQLFVVSGKKRVEVPALCAGDIGAAVKLKTTQINHTLHDKGFNVQYKNIEYPSPRIRVAVVPKTKGEEEKVGMGLSNLHAEDPSLVVEHSQELRQIILHAQGELHLAAAKWRLEHRYKVEADFIEPRVPYRETIQKSVRGMYRHKKQSGGAGQFAEVHMCIEPWYEGAPYQTDITIRGKDLTDLDWGGKLEFVNCIVGGVIDQRFLPAIMKGVMDKMQFGPLTGSYVRDVRLYVFDGKMHPVDSNEQAFKTAGTMVFKENFIKADPKVLEPIYNISVRVPEEFVGDVMSDLPSRRGVIIGIDSEGRYQIIKARMPLAELDKYSTALRSMTQARAVHTQEFAEYAAVPPMVQQKLIDDYKKKQEEGD